MDVEALTACWDAIAPAKRDDPEHIDRRLARQAVQSKSLTLWQATATAGGAHAAGTRSIAICSWT